MKPEQAEIARLKREVIKLKAERDILKRRARPLCKRIFQVGIRGLHQRIRSQGRALAKMDIRASRVLIKASVSSTAFRTRILSRRLDRSAICFTSRRLCQRLPAPSAV